MLDVMFVQDKQMVLGLRVGLLQDQDRLPILSTRVSRCEARSDRAGSVQDG